MKKFSINKYSVIIICLCFIIILLLLFIFKCGNPLLTDDSLLIHNFKGECVPDKVSAIKIAKVIYEVRTGIEFKEDEFKATYIDEDNAWNVVLIDYTEDTENTGYLDYRGIFIDKDYAAIVRDSITSYEVEKHQSTKLKYNK